MSSTRQFPCESDDQGRFVRQNSSFREVITERPEPGRYHLYVSLACPWASRIVIARKLKRLEDVLPMTIVDPVRDERGWRFTAEEPDPVNGYELLREAYLETDASYDARVTVPVLYDTVERRVVNNESGEIMRMLDGWSDEGPQLVPADLADEIDAINERVYRQVNNGVYRAGFATSQEAYDEAVADVFAGLDWLDERLATRRYLTGDRITEADWRLFTTLVRFDPVYYVHFKCNVQLIAQYPNLSGYLRDLYQQPGIAETVDFDHIKRHYYTTHPSINPTRIVPAGPRQDLWAPHGREHVGGADAELRRAA
jgi:putative glutathione S-transferase